MNHEERYIVVLKVGGNELDDPDFLFGLVNAVKAVMAEGHHPVIVHGGGKAVTDLQAKLGLKEQRIEGLRVTSDADMDVVEMVLSGLMNKRIVRAGQRAHPRRASAASTTARSTSKKCGTPSATWGAPARCRTSTIIYCAR